MAINAYIKLSPFRKANHSCAVHVFVFVWVRASIYVSVFFLLFDKSKYQIDLMLPISWCVVFLFLSKELFIKHKFTWVMWCRFDVAEFNKITLKHYQNDDTLNVTFVQIFACSHVYALIFWISFPFKCWNICYYQNIRMILGKVLLDWQCQCVVYTSLLLCMCF